MIARLLSALRAAKQHGTSSVLLISGVAGVGKTSVVTELCRQAAVMSLQVARSKCDEIDRIRPGTAVLALLRSGSAPLVSAGELARILQDADEPLLIADHFEAAAASSGPVLIAIDDVHWADPVSLFLLRTLVPRLAGFPVVWVLTSREETLDDFSGGHQAVRVLSQRLEPLSLEAVAAIAHDRLGYEPDEDSRRYLAATGGNALLATGVIDGMARAASAGGGAGATMAMEFDAAVAERLAGLDSGARDLVELLATAGRPMALRDVLALVQPVDGAVQAAMASQLVISTEDGLAMRHDLFGSAVRAAMPRKLLRDVHSRLAIHYLDEVGDPVMAASHARAAVQPGDLAGARILLCAAEQLSGLSKGDAADLAMLAFQTLSPQHPEWLELSRRCLSVLVRAERAREAIAAADVILAFSDDITVVGRVYAEAAYALWLSGRDTDLSRRVERILASSSLDRATASRLSAARALARARTSAGEPASTHATSAVEQARASGDTAALALAMQAAGEAARIEGRHIDALEYFRKRRMLTGAVCLPDEITALQFLDRYDDAQTLLNLARRVDGGRLELLPAVQNAQMWHDFLAGSVEDAETSAAAVLELGQQLGTNVHVLDARIVRTGVALLRDDIEGAAAQLSAADELVDADRAVRNQWLVVMRGWFTTRRGDLDASMKTLRSVMRGADAACHYWPLWPCWLGQFAAASAQAADREFAAEIAEAAQHLARKNPGVASLEGISLQLRGMRDNDLDLLAQAVTVLQASPRPFLRGDGAIAYGRALLETGHKADGLAQLDRAWDVFDRMGALASRAQAQQLMRDAGAHRTKWAGPLVKQNLGWEALTSAEQRVALLISAGLTNRSVATQLGVSVNTVGTQTRAIFSKLGVHSRVQLANALNGTGVSVAPSGPEE
ncbi:ATP-, maltotriose-and DNA-dependent transcriptional regulator MalT [Actinacidiphila rubida]|uniref:ATP-, maltotriose-and DNA-dependent transcriptional regulator MalT n=1 Tax=Actinacidiphila rubida TaxID=310780 RepID=A0A1H8TBA0_9ACTN|nr:ATP-, maltotriose-and DNA-dependent transcriptional regulator MalT [Actinacidiphila rubida]